MVNVFLAPRSNETSYKNFDSTITNGRAYDQIEPFLEEKEKLVLSKNKTVRVWGTKGSLKNRWQAMRPGDFVLFYRRGYFYYSARVVLTKLSYELGKELWPVDEDGEPWSCLFFVDDIQEINIPIKVVQELAEYSSAWDKVMGFMKLKERGVRAIADKCGSIESFLSQDQSVYATIDNIIESTKDEMIEMEEVEVDKDELLLMAAAYKQTGDSHMLSLSPKKIRIENKRQKKYIAAIENYSCQICGWFLEWTNSKGKKVYRIDIDHIIDKADGGGEEISNLWALCPNCHVKKTLGVITIDAENWKVFENKKEIPLHHNNHLGKDIPEVIIEFNKQTKN